MKRNGITLPQIPRRNNMDALRLLFGSVVIACHFYPLSLHPALVWLGEWANGGWPVRGFFIISGFLIFQSYEGSRTFGSYCEKRIRRIYPAYITVIVFWAIAGLFLTDLPLTEYLGKGLAGYLVNNLAFLNYRHPALPGVFSHNPSNAVDGALWTIKVEVMFYACVPALVWLLYRTRKDVLIAAVYAASMGYYLIFNHLGVIHHSDAYFNLAKQLPGQLAYFISGAALYYYFDLFRRWRRYLVPIAIGGLILGVTFAFEPILPAALGIVVIAAAFGPYAGNAGRYGDFSYGVYIWHFPVIQLLVSLGLFVWNPWSAIALTLVLSLGAAFTSWHLVEKPALRRDSHYRLAETAPKG